MKIPRLHTLMELGTNLVLPWVAYSLAAPRWGEMGGLLASAAPPLAWSLWELARCRRLDALSMLVLGGIVLSLIGLALGGDARLLLVRESLISGLIGLVFIGSLLMSRPLIFHLANATVIRQSRGEEVMEDVWRNPAIRRGLRVMTCVWGLALTGEALMRSWLAWNWPTERYLALAPLLSYGLMGLLALWTFLYRRRFTDAVPSEPMHSQTSTG